MKSLYCLPYVSSHCYMWCHYQKVSVQRGQSLPSLSEAAHRMDRQILASELTGIISLSFPCSLSLSLSACLSLPPLPTRALPRQPCLALSHPQPHFELGTDCACRGWRRGEWSGDRNPRTVNPWWLGGYRPRTSCSRCQLSRVGVVNMAWWQISRWPSGERLSRGLWWSARHTSEQIFSHQVQRNNWRRERPYLEEATTG